MSKNTRKRTSSSAKSKTTNVLCSDCSSRKTCFLHENIFASPWKKSDITLVVDMVEFHVHRQILTMHSPVFDAMFSGHFKEAHEDKVTLQGKTAADMLQFLKLLYPNDMVHTPLIDFKAGGKEVFAVLRIADEYQAEEMLKKSLEKMYNNIVSTNVFDILPYACKYNQKVQEKCVHHVAKYVMTEDLKKEFTCLEAPLIQQLLLAKCKELELTVNRYRQYVTQQPPGYVSTSDSSTTDSY